MGQGWQGWMDGQRPMAGLPGDPGELKTIMMTKVGLHVQMIHSH